MIFFFFSNNLTEKWLLHKQQLHVAVVDEQHLEIIVGKKITNFLVKEQKNP